MNDFKKALGILKKAKQGGLFEKPKGKIIGRTQAGKPIHEDFTNKHTFLEQVPR